MFYVCSEGDLASENIFYLYILNNYIDCIRKSSIKIIICLRGPSFYCLPLFQPFKDTHFTK